MKGQHLQLTQNHKDIYTHISRLSNKCIRKKKILRSGAIYTGHKKTTTLAHAMRFKTRVVITSHSTEPWHTIKTTAGKVSQVSNEAKPKSINITHVNVDQNEALSTCVSVVEINFVFTCMLCDSYCMRFTFPLLCPCSLCLLSAISSFNPLCLLILCTLFETSGLHFVTHSANKMKTSRINLTQSNILLVISFRFLCLKVSYFSWSYWSMPKVMYIYGHKCVNKHSNNCFLFSSLSTLNCLHR